MDQKPSLDLVYAAVSTLHSNPNPTEKERASVWLADLQKSVHAWTISDELLHHKRDLESCYFGAQTMRTKIHHSFHELPADVHGSLRDSLLEHISQINADTNTVIVTQLCLALADLVLQMPSWQHATLDLMRKFSSTNTWPLLEILTVLPEELEGRSVRLGENRRVAMLEDLKFCAPTVIEFLTHCSNVYGNNWQENVQVNVKILRCYSSWVSVRAIALDDGVSENVVVQRAFAILNYKSEGGEKMPTVVGYLHDAATDCICTLLQSIEDNNNQEGLESYLFNNIINLEMVYHLSVANEDQDESINYCRIFTELGETFLVKTIEDMNTKMFHYIVKVLDLVLLCVGHHEYEVAEITFNLWYVLSEELYSKSNKELTEMFRPYVERLVTALCRHCQMEPDHEGLLEDGDDFKSFRHKVSELIKDVVFIVGSSNCFRQMFVHLQSPGVTWDSSEAALFVMQAVAKIILPTENEVVPKVVEAILTLPPTTHIAVKYTSVLLLGELCEWIEEHPNTLDPILNFLVCCLPEAGVGAAAASALQSICATCHDQMPRHVPILLQLLHQVDTFAITNSAVIGLLKGVAAIVSRIRPPEEMTVALRELCLMQITPLCQLLDQDVVTMKGTKTDPVLWLDRLSAVLRNINVTVGEGEFHPCKPVMLEIWPILSRTLDKYQSDPKISENCCRSVRFMLRCISQQANEILEGLVSQIVRLYTEHKHSSFLYIGSILIDEYATNAVCIQGLLDMLQAFIQPTFQLLQEEDGLRKHPDTVDDFFRLCTRYTQRAPIPFLRCTALVPILQCGLMACTLDHREANATVMRFFKDLIVTGRCGGEKKSDEQEKAELKELVTSILNEYGQQLVTNLLHASVFYLRSYLFGGVADVFVEMLDFDRTATEKWLAVGLDTLPKQNNGGVMCATPQQLSDIHKSIIKSHTSRSITSALKELAWLYR